MNGTVKFWFGTYVCMYVDLYIDMRLRASTIGAPGSQIHLKAFNKVTKLHHNRKEIPGETAHTASLSLC